MIGPASRGSTALVGVWLIGLGIFMLTRPHPALMALSRMRDARHRAGRCMPPALPPLFPGGLSLGRGAWLS